MVGLVGLPVQLRHHLQEGPQGFKG
jgi:hypothetical protein